MSVDAMDKPTVQAEEKGVKHPESGAIHLLADE
jgi:hypothetical protein